jgi:hypothetical protein
MAKNLGANAAFSKPFSVVDLAKIITGLLGTTPSDHTEKPLAAE